MRKKFGKLMQAAGALLRAHPIWARYRLWGWPGGCPARRCCSLQGGALPGGGNPPRAAAHAVRMRLSR